MLPVLFQSHDLILYSYPLMMGLGWGVAYQIFFGLISKEISKSHAQIIFWGVFLSSWIGAKILFYLTIPSNYSQNLISQFSFWLGGGFVFYGGFIGACLFLIFYRLVGHVLNLERLWPILPALTFGHAIGRIGCGLAGCCYGEVTNWIWGIYLHGHYRHPTQFIEASVLLALGVFLVKSTKRKLVLFSYYFITYGVLRIVIEGLRGDEIRGVWGPLTPSQWISLLMILAGMSLKISGLIMTKQKSQDL